MFLLKDKSDIGNVFKIFYNMVETQFQSQIKIFQSDNGTEFFNNVLGKFFHEKGLFTKVRVHILPNKTEWLNEKTNIS